MRLTMRRTGQFDCHWQSTHNKCGVSDKLQTAYTYLCEIEASPTLDSRGFLFDQSDIDRYFQTRYWDEEPFEPRSCEQMAITGAKEIAEMLDNHFKREHNMRVRQIVRKITVSVGHGTPIVMTATWESDS